MADKAREWTDKKLAKMEREISLMYKKSAKDLYKKWDAYIGRGDKRIQTLEKDLRDAFKVGDEQVIAEVEKRLQKAKEAFTYKNEYYKQMLNSVTYDMAQVNNDVRAYINGQLPEIYAKNYAQANEIVEGMKLDFALPNEQAIKARILEGKVKTPFMDTDKFVKIPKDQRWNTKFINSQVMQGIIQGEDMRTISKRIFPEINAKNGGLPERNMASAIRNARTLVTGAENQGKHDSYKDLSERGMVLKQVWIATGDDRTREAHLEMDGQEVDIDEPFIAINRDGTECELEYPADPNGDAEQVYNCRCALTTKVVGFRNADGTIREIEEADEGQDLHDRQIAEEKERRMEEAERKEQAKENKEEINIQPDTSGVMKDVPKIQDEINVETVAKSVNPKIDQDIDFRAYSQNCANCVVATEARFRGYDVIAKGRDFSRDSNIYSFYYDNRQGHGSWTDSFKNMKGEPIEVKRKNQIASAIADKMQEYGEGSRAVIFVQWDGKTVGHYFNVMNEKGKTIFFDSQDGKIGKEAEDYFMSVKPSKTRIWRTDDKEMTDFIRKVVDVNE